MGDKGKLIEKAKEQWQQASSAVKALGKTLDDIAADDEAPEQLGTQRVDIPKDHFSSHRRPDTKPAR